MVRAEVNRVAGAHRIPGIGAIVALMLSMVVTLVPPSTPPAVAADGQDPVSCPGAVALVNGGFEQPVLSGIWGYRNENDVPGWLTTARDNQIELWHSGFNGVPAHSGSQFAELNATEASTLYQSVTTTPGQALTWSLAHRGRLGTDTMAVEIGPPGGPYVEVARFSDTSRAWGVHSGEYVVPAGQTTTEFRFRAVSAAGGTTQGNFLDSITFGTGACVVTSKSVVNTSRPSGPAQVGDELSYTVSATNAGGRTSAGTVIEDAIPAGTTYVAGSLRIATSPVPGRPGPVSDAVDGDTGSVTDGTVRVHAGTGATGAAGGNLLPGETESLTFRVRVDTAAAAGSVVNQATTTYTGGQPSPSTSNRVTTPVAAAADLAVTKISDPDTQMAGNEVTYRVEVTNNGPDDAERVEVVDTLPAGTNLVDAAAPPGTTCTRTGQEITCRTEALADGATLTIPITITIAPDQVDALVNAVTVSSATSDQDTTNNTATATTTVTSEADVAIDKAVDPASAPAGTEVTYTLTASNAGPSDAADLVVTDTLPAGMSVISATPSTGTCTTTTSSVSCELGTVAPGSTPSVEVVAAISASAEAASLVNTAAVTTSTSDPDPENNSSQTPLEVTTEADLSIVKSGPDQATAGGSVTFTAVVTNDGPSDAQGVVVDDPTPEGLTLSSMATTQGTCEDTTCTIGTLAAGASATVTMVYDVDEDRTNDLENVATVTASTPDPDSDDLTSSVTVPVETSADLALTKTQEAATIVFGEPVTYTLSVTNLGPSTAVGATITDTIPPGLMFRSSDDCSQDGGQVVCEIDTIAVGDTVEVTFVADTLPGGSGEITNTAEVTADTPDPEDENNSATVTANGAAAADLTLTKSTTPQQPTAGEQVTYAITATNLGPSTATGISVVDTLPDGVSAVDADDACTIAEGTVTCAAASLEPEDSVTFEIIGVIAPDTRGESTNSATVTAQTPGDETPGNNTGTSTVTVDADADVYVDLEPENQTAVAGQTVTFTLTAGNNGPSTATGVVVTGQVPSGLRPVEGSSGGACTVTGRTVTCELGDLAPGEQVEEIELEAIVDEALPAGTEVLPLAHVGSQTPDTDPDNNSDQVSVLIEAVADLSVTKSVTPEPPVAGADATYTVTVSNAGPSTATEVVATDSLPDGFTVTTVTAGAGTCEADAAPMTCTIAALAPGTSVDITIAGTLAPGLTGTVSNTAFVTSDVTDPVLSDNETSRTDPIAASADLRVDKSGPATAVAGGWMEYTVTVTNAGPSDATDVVLTDPLPAGLLPDGVEVAVSETTTCSTSPEVGCSIGTLAAGDYRVITISARVDQQAVGTELVNVAVVDTSTDGPDGGRTSPEVVTEVEASADVGVTKLAGAAAVAGGQMRYVLVVSNAGPSFARDITVTDPTPTGLALTTAVATEPGTCTVDGALECGIDELAPGAVVTITVAYDVAADMVGESVTNTVTITTGTSDPETDNDTSSVTVTVAPPDPGPGPSPQDRNDDPGPGGGGSALPGTGASVSTWVLVAVVVLIGAGVVLVIVRRRADR